MDNFNVKKIVLRNADDTIPNDIFASQSDADGRILSVQLLDNGNEVNTTGYSLKLAFKTDKEYLYDFESSDLTKGIYKIAYPSTMLVPGYVSCEIWIYYNGNITSTKPFQALIGKSVITGAPIVASDEFTTLQNMIISVQGLEDAYAPRLTKTETDISKLNTNLGTKAPLTAIDNIQSQIDVITTQADNYYVKCLQTDTGALLVVSSGATTGQINLASVTPHMSDYTPVASDYVTKAYNTLNAETKGLRTSVDGNVFTTAREAVVNQITNIKTDLNNVIKLDSDTKFNIIEDYLEIKHGYYSVGSTTLTSETVSYDTYVFSCISIKKVKIALTTIANYADTYSYFRALDSKGNIIDAHSNLAGTNVVNETIDIPSNAVLFTITVRKDKTFSFEKIGATIAERNEKSSLPFRGYLSDNERNITNTYYKKEQGYYPVGSSTLTSAGVYDTLWFKASNIDTIRYVLTTIANYDSTYSYLRFLNKSGNIITELANSAGTNNLDSTSTVPINCENITITVRNDKYYCVMKTGTDRIDEIEGGYAIWIGDSYVQASSLASAGLDQNKRFSTLVSNRLNLIEKNYAVGGMGYVYGTTTFITQLNNAIADTTYNHTKVKKIFVCGGRNDAQTVNENYGGSIMSDAVTTLVNTARAEYPNAEIIIIPMLWDYTILNRATYVPYENIIRAARTLNCVVIPNAYMWMIGMKGCILADLVHPNIDGHAIIASHIMDSITTGNSMPYPASMTLSANAELPISNGARCVIEQENGKVLYNIFFNATSNISAYNTLFSKVVTNTQNIPIFLGTQNVSLYAYGVNTYVELYVQTEFTESGYAVYLKPNQNIAAGAYNIHCELSRYGRNEYSGIDV